MRKYLRSLTKLENIKDAHPDNTDITDGLTKVQKMIFQMALKDDGRTVTLNLSNDKLKKNGRYASYPAFEPEGIEGAI